MSISDYSSLLKIGCRIVKQTPFHLLWKIGRNFAWRNFWYMRKFEKRAASGKPFFPAFVMISVTETCNLACSGCWVTAGGRKSLTMKQLDGIITSSKAEGAYFFGILGGEPLMFRGLLDVLEQHGDCYFQLFTNGTLLTDEVAQRLRKMGHVTPLISVEGLEEESDHRRGRNDVYHRTLEGIKACRRAGLIFGLAASICKDNYNELACHEHVVRAAQLGAAYLWYYIYRPVGANPRPEAALSKEQIRGLREFLVEERRNAPLVLIDTYWDEKGVAMCPGATGMSHHIAPSGALEFCPPLQLAREFINDHGSDTARLFKESTFLHALRAMTADASRGCILLEDPKRLAAFLREQQAVETTTRASVLAEYDHMTPLPGHDMGEEAIPEKSAPYRWLKKRYFFGFGAYG